MSMMEIGRFSTDKWILALKQATADNHGYDIDAIYGTRCEDHVHGLLQRLATQGRVVDILRAQSNDELDIQQIDFRIWLPSQLVMDMQVKASVAKAHKVWRQQKKKRKRQVFYVGVIDDQDQVLDEVLLGDLLARYDAGMDQNKLQHMYWQWME